ncbi:hypothetical protein HW555_009741 [Spodoptera exigua]|uniref:Uncharacterized protein n=1 Tax=Spodoptera exigua TaxID=7107 RepID=A0A835G8E0_SPOEX|nr:hypothetical protein HW555_009741 [Spodoptera exigua]
MIALLNLGTSRNYLDNVRRNPSARCTASAVVGRSKTSLVTYRGPSNVRINRIVINSPIQANIYHSALDTNNMEIRITSNMDLSNPSEVKPQEWLWAN